MDEVHLVQNPLAEPIDVDKLPIEVVQNIGLRLAAAEGLSKDEILEAYISALPDIVTTSKGDIRLVFVVS